jgi:hypothetical protein
MRFHEFPASVLAHTPAVENIGGIARADQHRVNPGLLAAGDTYPLPALGHEPQRLV